MTRAFFTALIATLCFTAAPVHADPITYTLSSDVSGTLGGVSFTDVLVTITLVGDTANVVPGPSPFTDVVTNTGTATVDVSGIGTATFTDAVGIVDTLTDPTSLGVPGVLLMLDLTTDTGLMLETGLTFLTYGLTSPIGPISGVGGVASGSAMTPVFATTGGDLTWTVGQSLGTATFTATTATPEPSGVVVILGIGIGLVFVRHRFSHARL
jgi:hypothetical protein